MEILKQLFGGFYDPSDTNRAQELIDRCVAKYGEPSVGRNRAVFISKFCVLKVPINDNGIADNDWEGSMRSPTTAKGRWLQINGLICCMQERLTIHTGDGELPEWTNSVDCCQVGYDAKGNLKAFDFGLR